MEKGPEMEPPLKTSLIEIEQAETVQEALDSLTDDLFEAIKTRVETGDGRFTVLLPAGSAAEKLFVVLKDRMKEIDATNVHFIQGEQLWPIPKEHPANLLGGMEKMLLDAGIPKTNIHEFNSEAETEDEAVGDVIEALQFGVDYAILGLNASGAIAGLRDGEEFKTKHFDLVDLDIKTPQLHSRESLGMTDLPYVAMDKLVKMMNEKYWPDNPEDRPSRMFAPGWKYMLEASKLAILATGSGKKEAVETALANIGKEIPIKGTDGGLIDVMVSQERDVEDRERHLTSTGEIALSRMVNQLPTEIYTDFPLK